MSYPLSVDYDEGNKVIAGPVTLDQAAPLVADKYYQGMPLKYEVDGTAAYVGTGNGTCTAITAGKGVKAGDWTFTFLAALLGYLSDPDGNIVAYLSLVDGGAAAFDVGGLKFTITDGGTAFAAGGVWTITIGTGGKYEYTSDLYNVDAIYNGADERTLGSAGYGAIITGGEVWEGGLVNDSGTVLTLTEATRAALRKNGFYPRRAA